MARYGRGTNQYGVKIGDEHNDALTIIAATSPLRGNFRPVDHHDDPEDMEDRHQLVSLLRTGSLRDAERIENLRQEINGRTLAHLGV